MVEGFDEFGISRQVTQTATLDGQWRIENEVSIAGKHCSSHFSLDRSEESDGAAFQMKSAGIAFESQVADSDRIPT